MVVGVDFDGSLQCFESQAHSCCPHVVSMPYISVGFDEALQHSLEFVTPFGMWDIFTPDIGHAFASCTCGERNYAREPTYGK